MLFNEILSNRINKEDLPDNTDCVILHLNPNQEIVQGYLENFNKIYPSTKEHEYRILNVYFLRGSTLYWNKQEILDTYKKCAEESWREYNTEGNKLSIQTYNYKQLVDCSMVEYEELDIIYNVETPLILNYSQPDGTEVYHNLVYKKSVNTYYGKAGFVLEGNTVEVEKTYTRKPSENKLKSDLLNKFCNDYNVVLEG